jgi:hypothetical protein
MLQALAFLASRPFEERLGARDKGGTNGWLQGSLAKHIHARESARITRRCERDVLDRRLLFPLCLHRAHDKQQTYKAHKDMFSPYQ